MFSHSKTFVKNALNFDNATIHFKTKRCTFQTDNRTQKGEHEADAVSPANVYKFGIFLYIINSVVRSIANFVGVNDKQITT